MLPALIALAAAGAGAYYGVKKMFSPRTGTVDGPGLVITVPVGQPAPPSMNGGASSITTGKILSIALLVFVGTLLLRGLKPFLN